MGLKNPLRARLNWRFSATPYSVRKKLGGWEVHLVYVRKWLKIFRREILQASQMGSKRETETLFTVGPQKIEWERCNGLYQRHHVLYYCTRAR